MVNSEGVDQFCRTGLEASGWAWEWEIALGDRWEDAGSSATAAWGGIEGYDRLIELADALQAPSLRGGSR